MITKQCKKPNFCVVVNVVKPVSLVLDAVVQKDKAKAEHASLLVLPFPIHSHLATAELLWGTEHVSYQPITALSSRLSCPRGIRLSNLPSTCTATLNSE